MDSKNGNYYAKKRKFAVKEKINNLKVWGMPDKICIERPSDNQVVIGKIDIPEMKCKVARKYGLMDVKRIKSKRHNR